MGINKKNIWEFGDGYYKVHITNIDAYEKIKDFLGIDQDSYYKKNGEIFAWDVTVEEKKLPKVKKILKEFV
jgi:hypothetical protein|tara:strand:+ start:858 stop:1070 length:213 start_codon:yes stop_codon:yes gene_type:complete